MSAPNHNAAGQGHQGIPTTQEVERWDDDKLLEWIQRTQPKFFRDDKAVSAYKAAKISGSTFLKYAEDSGLLAKIRLPLGVHSALWSLARRVKTQNDQPNQTAGRKRKGKNIFHALYRQAADNITGDETDEPEKPPISAKRCRQEYLLTNLALMASERRRCIKKIITEINGSSDHHSHSVDSLTGAIDKLSDPTFERRLPFPFVGFEAPARFNVQNADRGDWSYVGREKLKTLVLELKKVRMSGVYSTLWLYGTQGYGKSHLLAALVCCLAAQDEQRVVYIPTCQTLLENPVNYVRSAMLFAWADHAAIQKEIMTLNTERDIEDFFDYQRLQCNSDVIFVVDQMNALKDSTAKASRTKEWLTHLASGHKRVYSSSANYKDYLDQSVTENQNSVLLVYGGLTKTEMEQWWFRHADVEMGEYDRSEVEDTTGCIPLLLDKCVVGGKIDLDATELANISAKAKRFVTQIAENMGQDSPRWITYCNYVTACFCRRTVSVDWFLDTDLIDHRYFYRQDGRGNYTCGLVRNAVAEKLLESGANFADTNFLKSLPEFSKIKHAVVNQAL